MKRLPVVPHLSYEEIDRRYRGCSDAAEKTRWHVPRLVNRPDQPLSATKAAELVGFTPGPWADIKLLERSRLLKRLPEGVGGIGDLGYVGIGELHPTGSGAAPRRKPRGKERPPADRKYNRAFSRRRIVVEHAIGRLRRFRAVAHVNRHPRRGHAMRVRATAGLVNRMLKHRTAS